MKELGDTLASPAGWHTLPVSHDPITSKEDGTTVGRFLESLGFEVRTYDVDIKGARTGARPRQRGATTFSRTRIGKAMMLGCITIVL